MATEVGALVVNVSANTVGAERGLDRVEGSVVDLQEAADKAKGKIGGVSAALGALGVAGDSAVGSLAAVSQGMLEAFSTGGGIAIGVTAIGVGIWQLSEYLAEAAKESRQLEALGEVFGVAEQDVQNLRRSLRALGADVDQAMAQQIMLAGREAKLTTEEVILLADEIKRAADLTGGDYAAASAQVFAQQKDDLQEVIELLRLRNAELVKGANPELFEAAKAQIGSVRQVNELLAEQAAKQAEIARLSKEIEEAEQRAILLSQGKGTGTAAAAAEAERLRDELAVVEAEYAAIGKRIDEARAKQVELNDEAGLLRFRKRIAEASVEIRKSQEEAAKEAQRRQEEALALMGDELQARRDMEAEAAALAEARIAAAMEMDQQIRVLQAQAAKDREAELRAQADAEIQAEWDKLAALGEITQEQREQFDAWERAREAKLAADVRELREREAEATHRELQRAAAEARREREELLRADEAAKIAGTQAGFAFIGGLKSALESGDTASIFRALLQGGASIAGMISGGGLFGSILGGIGSLFHDGGMVGAGGAPLPRYHSGGMIVAHNGVMLAPEPRAGEVDIRAQLGEGVLSRLGVAAAGGPSAVRALNRGEGVGGGVLISMPISVGGTLVSEDMVARMLGPTLRRMAIEAIDPVMRRLQPQIGNLTTRG